MDLRLRSFQRVTVFGGMTVDRVAAAHGRPVAGASNPGTISRMAGGVGFNVATILARLAVPTRLVGRVGADGDGETVIGAAQTAGVDTTAVSVSPAGATGSYIATLDDRGGLVIGIADMSVYAELTPGEVAPAVRSALADEAWLVDANLPIETLDYLIGEASAAQRPVMALTVSPAKAVRLRAHLGRLTVLFTNRREGAALLGWLPEAKGYAAADLARELASTPGSNVVVSDGAGLVAVASGRDLRSFAPFRALVRNVNGAGDALAAGVVYGFYRGRSLYEGVIDGLATAALVIESPSAIEAPVDTASLSRRIGENGHS